MGVLAVLIAKSGISLYSYLPQDYEITVADCSRIDRRPMALWSQPRLTSYDEIILIERRTSTALTQRQIATALQAQGIQGPIHFAAFTPETPLAYSHQDYLIVENGLCPIPVVPPAHLPDRYFLAVVGLPGVGKSLLCSLLRNIQECSLYTWEHFLAQTLAQLRLTEPATDGISWQPGTRLTAELAVKDRLMVARSFLAHTSVQNDYSRFMVVDGMKSREELVYTSFALQRPAIIVAIQRDEADRQLARRQGERAYHDDEAEEVETLHRMGVLDLIQYPDFTIETTGCQTLSNQNDRWCHMQFTERFINDLHVLLEWLYLSPSLPQTKKWLYSASKIVAQQQGYRVVVKIV